ncbi:MAG: SDR family NAD(P)-dependent oxidoreductase, partial [Bacteroidetes bacterium]|nr:SDR family NAD(P)-dependent oxidoreductase [Bacteroidota bacterium]
MDLKLQEKVAIITGASRGIGRGIAQSLANEGCHLVICARGEDALMDTANALSASGGSVKPMVVDILDDGAADCLVSAA